MKVIKVDSLGAPELEVYGTLTEAQLRNRLEPEKGLFIAESPKVISVALDAGLEPVSLLCERKHIEGDARNIIARCPEDMPVYTGSRELLAQLTGYTLTRGVLCAMRRPKPLPPEDVCKGARRIVVLHGVCDTTNVGAIFRSAAALGIDAVLMTSDSCDPLNRRAVRVSMGSVFLVPWTWLDSPPPTSPRGGRLSAAEYPSSSGERLGEGAGVLHHLGFTTAAMALHHDNISIDDPRLKAIDRLALIMGTEGDGLPRAVIEAADLVVKIPMHHGVDSLNVATAAAIAFWELAAGKAKRIHSKKQKQILNNHKNNQIQNTMKKILMTLAAVFCCTIFTSVVCTSCTKDDVSDIYVIGFENAGYDIIGETLPDTKQEMSWISTAFNDALKQELGVTVNDVYFRYGGGWDKVKAACEKAAAELATKTFQAHYVYSISNIGITVYVWRN